MRMKIGNQKAARYMIGDGACEKCVFYLKPLRFFLSMNCDIYGSFHQTETLEDIFKL